MARLLRVQFEGAIYHVALRGVEQRTLFTEERECARFLERVSDGRETHDVRVYMYCLMGNHAHMLVETPHANLDRFMHGLNTAYTVYFNRRHRRAGHLFQGRYGAVLVEGDEYLLRLSRYLHLNPAFTRKTKSLPLKERLQYLRAYKWSSYPAYTGRAKPDEFMDYGPVLSMFGRKKKERRSAYRRYVESGIAETDEEFIQIIKESPLAIGGDEFRTKIDELYNDLLSKHAHKEDVSFRRIGKRLDAYTVVATVCEVLGVEIAEARTHRIDGIVRSVTAKMLCKYAGLTQREAAEELGLSTGAAVSMQLRRLKSLMRKNKDCARKVGKVEKRLASMNAEY